MVEKRPSGLQLSIVIPTYNRVNFLKTAVDRFISQIKAGGFEEEVEIVIGDDASPDKTGEYLQRLSRKFLFVRSFTNETNLGLSGNFEKLVNYANAPFLWLFGEDDLITEGALQRLMDSIRMDQPNMVLLNTTNITSLDDRNLKYKVWEEDRLDIQEDIFINSFEKEKEKLKKVKNWLYLTNLVSASAFRKDLYLKTVEEAKKHVRFDSVYFFQAPLIIGLAEWGRFKIIAKRSVLHRKNETHWSKNVDGLFRVSLYDGGEIVKLIKKYIPSEYKSYQKIFAVQTFTAVKAGKTSGIPVTKNIIDAIRVYYDCFPYSVRFFIALITPGFVFKLYKKI